MHLLRFKPWERGALDQALARLLDREERARTPPLGRALDLGRGSGLQTVELVVATVSSSGSCCGELGQEVVEVVSAVVPAKGLAGVL